MNLHYIYHKWLQIEVAEGTDPSYYALLGLKTGEPDVNKIKAAVETMLDRLHDADVAVEGTESERAEFGEVFHQILRARYVLLTPEQKKGYDAHLLSGNGARVWEHYERPTLFMRFRQFGLITVGFSLGCVIMMMMAMMVQRNPDGSVVFHEEVKVEKAKLFTVPLVDVVYRPALAKDFREGGYEAVSVAVKNSPNQKKVFNLTDENPLEIVSEEPGKKSDFAGKKSEDSENTLSTADASDTQNAQSESENIFTILPESEGAEMSSDEVAAADNNEDEDFTEAVSGTDVSSDSSGRKSRRENPLYGRFRKNSTGVSPVSPFETASLQAESVSENSRGNGVREKNFAQNSEPTSKPAFSAVSPEVPSPEAPAAFPDVHETALDSDSESESGAALEPVLPQSMMTVLENTRKDLDFSDEKAVEAYLLLQYNTCSTICRKAEEKPETFEKSAADEFIAYALDVCTDLGWNKRFEEAFQLCALLSKLGNSVEAQESTISGIAARKTSLENYKAKYEDSFKILEALKANPEDKDLNTRYALWLMNENASVAPAIPYFAKCRYSILSQAASFEMQVEESEYKADPKHLLRLADTWWLVASKVGNTTTKRLMEVHACSFYEKVDQNMLNEEQQLRVSSLNDTIKK